MKEKQTVLGSDPLERITPDMISRVMAELGRRKSPAKTAAARANAKKPRPNARGKKRKAKKWSVPQ